MSEWKKTRLGNLISIKGGFSYKGEFIGKGKALLLGMGCVSFSENFLHSGARLYSGHVPNTFVAKPNDIVLATRQQSDNMPILGVPAIIPESLKNETVIVGTNLYKVENESEVSNNFLFWLLKNIDYRNHIDSCAKGSTVKMITKDAVESYEFLCPPEKERNLISGTLWSINNKIDLLHRQNATLEKMAETLFRQWFVEEEKEGWKEGILDDILTVKGGSTPITGEPAYWNGTIHWTSPRDITNLNGIYLFDTERKITKLGLSKISSGLLPKGTLLMSSRAPVGVLAFSEVPIAINQGYIAILDNKGYSKEFIYLWLKSNIDTVHSFSNGSTFMEISKSTFKTLQLLIPPKQTLNDFQLLIKPFFEKIKSGQSQICTLKALRDTLLPRLMNGEVTVEI